MSGARLVADSPSMSPEDAQLARLPHHHAHLDTRDAADKHAAQPGRSAVPSALPSAVADVDDLSEIRPTAAPTDVPDRQAAFGIHAADELESCMALSADREMALSLARDEQERVRSALEHEHADAALALALASREEVNPQNVMDEQRAALAALTATDRVPVFPTHEPAMTPADTTHAVGFTMPSHAAASQSTHPHTSTSESHSTMGNMPSSPITPLFSLRASLADSAERVLENLPAKVNSLYLSPMRFGPPVANAHLASAFDMYTTPADGVGWDCGYRNAQMLLSALLNNSQISAFLSRYDVREVPVVPEIQARIERAWTDHAFDEPGAAHFERTLVGKHDWIGACEIAVFLRSLGLRACVADFDMSAGALARLDMLEWIYDYFHVRCLHVPMHTPSETRHKQSARQKPSCMRCCTNMFGRMTRQPNFIAPLFLQHEGHSRTVVGCEKLRSGRYRLLVVDPVYAVLKMLTRASVDVGNTLRHLRIDQDALVHSQYQIAFIALDPFIRDAEEYERLKEVSSTRQQDGSV